MASFIEKCWYKKHPLRWVLWPFSLLFSALIVARFAYLTRFKQVQFEVPVIVVGNITVGGVGKTPLVIALAEEFKRKGLAVGIVSRGYGAKITHFPHEVSLQDTAQSVGDEPLLLARKTDCPVVIAPDRVKAVKYLLAKHKCQIVLSDDGLQHYAMGRAIEIAVIDGLRQLGNGLCLPAGPLREQGNRLQRCDFLVVNEGSWPNAYPMHLQAGQLTNLLTQKKIDGSQLETPVAAVAAIGHPERFFNTLQAMKLGIKKYPFPDHHPFQEHELHFAEKTVVMTEKDAIKCYGFAQDSWYVLPVEAKLSNAFWQALWSHERLKGYLR
ncbi:MAG: tetraacyldisaccharide 4'-kinase [Tatlockia sp.]|jgi:tetraacyldisaccharide 4'-kinase